MTNPSGFQVGMPMTPSYTRLQMQAMSGDTAAQRRLRLREMRAAVRRMRHTMASVQSPGAQLAYRAQERRRIRHHFRIAGSGAAARNRPLPGAAQGMPGQIKVQRGLRQGRTALGGGPLPANLPRNPALSAFGAGAPNTVPVSSSFASAQSYLSTGPWQPNAAPAALPPPQNAAPTQPLAGTVPPGTVPPGTVPPGTMPQPATAPPAPGTNSGNNNATNKANRALQRSLEGVSVRLDRLSGAMARRVPAPGGVAPLIWTLAVLLIAVVPVNANGATRLKLLWYTITGNAWLPGVQYGGAAGGQGGAGSQSPSGDSSAILSPPPPGGGQGGLGGLGVLGRGLPVRVPTSLPIGPWGPGTGAMRVPGRATRGGGQHSRVAQIAQTGLNVRGNGGVRIVPPAAEQGANSLPYHPTASPQAPLIFPPNAPRRPRR